MQRCYQFNPTCISHSLKKLITSKPFKVWPPTWLLFPKKYLETLWSRVDVYINIDLAAGNQVLTAMFFFLIGFFPKNAFFSIFNYRIIALTLRRACKFIPPPPVRLMEPLSRVFRYLAILWSDFAFSGKPSISTARWGIFYRWWRCWKTFDLLNKTRYILWEVALLKACGVTNNGTILAAILDFIKN